MGTAYLSLGRMVETDKLSNSTYRRALELGLQQLLNSTTQVDSFARAEVQAALFSKPLKRRRTTRE